MSKELRRLIIFGAPFLVGVLNIFHPVHFEATGVYKEIHDKVNWWILLHILNLFGFALLGLAAYLLIKDQHGITATIAKIAIAVFIPTYAGFDSVIGIGTGVLICYANGVPADQLTILVPTINVFWMNNIAALLAILGSVSWGLGMSMSAATLTEAKRRTTVIVLGFVAGVVTGWGFSTSMFGTLPWWIAVVAIGVICLFLTRFSILASLLMVSGILFGTTHVVPYGPLGMACFLTAITLLEVAPNKAKLNESMAVTSS